MKAIKSRNTIIAEYGDSATPIGVLMKHVNKGELTTFGERVEVSHQTILDGWLYYLLREEQQKVTLYLTSNWKFSKYSRLGKEYLDGDNLEIIDASQMTLPDLLAHIEEQHQKGFSIIFIDFLVGLEGFRCEPDYVNAVNKVKRLAAKLDVAIICYSLLLEELYLRNDISLKPELKDFECWGHFAYLSDTVISFYSYEGLEIERDENGNDLTGILEFQILKAPLIHPFSFWTKQLSPLVFYLYQYAKNEECPSIKDEDTYSAF